MSTVDMEKENMHIKLIGMKKGEKEYVHIAILYPLSIDPPLSLDLRDKSANKRASIFFLFLLFNHTMFQLQF